MIRLTLIALAATLALAAPASAAPWKPCGRVLGDRVQANRATSCALARNVARHDRQDFDDGARVAVRSPVTGRTYRFFLWFSDAKRWVVHANGGRHTTLSVQVRVR